MLKFLLYAALAYLLLRAVANLLRAMLRRPDGVSAGPQNGRSRSGGGGRRSADDERATRLRDEDDVEDARWEDL